MENAQNGGENLISTVIKKKKSCKKAGNVVGLTYIMFCEKEIRDKGIILVETLGFDVRYSEL